MYKSLKENCSKFKFLKLVISLFSWLCQQQPGLNKFSPQFNFLSAYFSQQKGLSTCQLKIARFPEGDSLSKSQTSLPPSQSAADQNCFKPPQIVTQILVIPSPYLGIHLYNFLYEYILTLMCI